MEIPYKPTAITHTCSFILGSTILILLGYIGLSLFQYQRTGVLLQVSWVLVNILHFAWICVYSMCVCAHPVVELGGELGLEAAHGSFSVVSLNKHLGDQRCIVPQLLKVMKLSR